MAKMDTATLRHLCTLSKLSFTEEEQEKVMEQMGDIINLMDTIQDFNITYDDTKDHNEISYGELRQDKAGDSFPTEKLLSNTEPGGNGDCYALPKMME